MSLDILETYENKDFFNLKKEKTQHSPGEDEALLGDHEIFNMKPPKVSPKTKSAPPPLEFTVEAYETERMFWKEKIESLSESLKSRVGSDDTLSSIANVYTDAVERYHSYAIAFSRKNAMYKIQYVTKQEELLKGDRKVTKGLLDTRVDALLAFEKMELENLQGHMAFLDEMRAVVNNIFYMVRYYERFRDILGATNLK
jgi:hypothetical protein